MQLYKISWAAFGVFHAVLVAPLQEECRGVGEGAEEVYQSVVQIRWY